MKMNNEWSSIVRYATFHTNFCKLKGSIGYKYVSDSASLHCLKKFLDPQNLWNWIWNALTENSETKFTLIQFRVKIFRIFWICQSHIWRMTSTGFFLLQCAQNRWACQSWVHFSSTVPPPHKGLKLPQRFTNLPLRSMSSILNHMGKMLPYVWVPWSPSKSKKLSFNEISIQIHKISVITT